MIIRETDILKVLLEHPEDLNISRISKIARIDYKNTHAILQRLEKQKIIRFEEFGKSKKCILIKKAHPLIYETETKRKNIFLKKHKNLRVLCRKLHSLPFPFIALVFGSYAKGKAPKHSDIDILTISEDNRKRAIYETTKLLPLKIHLIQINFEEFMIMLKSKEFSVVSEATKENILLVGIEDYYRVIENAV